MSTQHQPVSNSLPSEPTPPLDAAGHAANAYRKPTIYADGTEAYTRIFAHIAAAQHTIEVRAFVWRDDDTGRAVARALLAAAERGVKVSVYKDRVAASYEYHGGTRQSLFHKRIGFDQRLQTWVLDRAYSVRGSLAQRPSVEAIALLSHPNVQVEHARKRFDHAKVWVFDDQALMLGGMGIGDDHRHRWVDFMVELQGAPVVQRLRQRLAAQAAFDPARPLDFLAHSRGTHGLHHCPMLEQRLALINAATSSLHIAMAYLGDARFTEALLAAVNRGVSVSLITSARADVMGHINRATCNKLFAHAQSDRLQIFVHPQMVHAKAIVIDERICDIGSANFTPLSHGVYDEVNLYVNDPAFAQDLVQAMQLRAAEATRLSRRFTTAKAALLLERAVVAYMSRRAAKRHRQTLLAP